MLFLVGKSRIVLGTSHIVFVMSHGRAGIGLTSSSGLLEESLSVYFADHLLSSRSDLPCRASCETVSGSPAGSPQLSSPCWTRLRLVPFSSFPVLLFSFLRCHTVILHVHSNLVCAEFKLIQVSVAVV